MVKRLVIINFQRKNFQQNLVSEKTFQKSNGETFGHHKNISMKKKDPALKIIIKIQQLQSCFRNEMVKRLVIIKIFQNLLAKKFINDSSF